MEIAVLGAGLVGGPMAIDLSKDQEFNVTIVDINEDTLHLRLPKKEMSPEDLLDFLKKSIRI